MKRSKFKKFGRESIQRKAFLRSLAVALITYGKIRTTKVRARALSRYADKLITVAKKDTLASKRQLLKDFRPEIVKKLVSELVPQFSSRKGGYTRVLNLGQRHSDSAHMAIIEFVK